MAENKQDGIAIFDTLFTNNHICMMKLMLPLLPPSLQKWFALYIKYMELQYTFQYFSRHPLGLIGADSSGSASGPHTILENMLPYCTAKERQNLTQIQNMIQTMQSMKDMMEMMDNMKELFPEGFAGASDGMDISQMAEIFSSFGGFNSSD